MLDPNLYMFTWLVDKYVTITGMMTMMMMNKILSHPWSLFFFSKENTKLRKGHDLGYWIYNSRINYYYHIKRQVIMAVIEIVSNFY